MQRPSGALGLNKNTNKPVQQYFSKAMRLCEVMQNKIALAMYRSSARQKKMTGVQNPYTTGLDYAKN